MSDQIQNTDTKEDNKTHPRAMDCLIISFLPIILFLCGCAINFLADTFEEHYYGIAPYNKIILMMLLPIACLVQPFGILLGIYALSKIRKESHFSGKVYVIVGIALSAMTIVLVGLVIMFPEIFYGE